MIRKAILLIVSFAVLLTGFWVYQSLSGAAWTTPSRRGDAGQSDLMNGPDDDAREPKVMIRGEDGRLQAIYAAGKVRKEADGSFTLTRPRFEVHLENGQIVYVQARQANVIGEETSGGVQPNSGRMTGDVRIVIDRKPGPVPREQRPDQLIRIHLNDIEFDNQLLTLTSQGRVTVWSREADIYGDGFFMSWNQEPRELRKLRIEKGDSLFVKQLQEELDMLFLPGGEGKPASTAPDEAGRTAPASQQGPAGQPALAAGQKQPGDMPPARNIFRVDLHENVKVSSGNRSMKGVEVLSLLFHWDGEFQDPMAADSGQGNAQPGQTGPTGSPQDDPTGSDETEPAPVEPSEGASDPQVLQIHWTGVLELTPTGHTAQPDSEHYRIDATGREVVLSDGGSRATCSHFKFRNPERVGKLESDGDQPVRLTLEDGQTMEAPELSFDMLNRRAYFVGAGRMLSPAGAGREFVSAAPGLSSRQELPEASAPAGQDQIRWQDRVEARFRKEDSQLTQGGNQQRLEEAVFYGDVEMFTAAGDYLLCDDSLTIEMTTGQGPRAYPAFVRAEGNAWASWEQSALEARTITIRFKEVLSEESQELQQPEYEVHPSRLEARGDVFVASVTGADRLLEAFCDRLDSDLMLRSATLTGAPARTVSGSDELQAGEIFVQRQVEADTGREGMDLHAGEDVKLRFTTDRDLNGNRLDTPRPVNITSDSLEFLSLYNTATFKGDVRLVSTSTLETADDPQTIETDTLETGQLKLLFVSDEAENKTDDPSGGAGDDAKTAIDPAQAQDEEASTSRRSLALDMGNYSSRKISTMIADEQVEIVSRQANSQDQTLLKMTLKGSNLTYDTLIRQMVMTESGRLLVEDYRPSRLPEKKDPDSSNQADATLTGSVVAPSQTVFAWSKGMTFKQDKREVLLEGDVQMAHVSGNKVVYQDRLQAPDWGKLESGKRLDLRRADVLIARFAQDQPEETDGAQADTPDQQTRLDPALGSLHSLTARGNVLLENQNTSVVAESLNYTRPLKMVTILGHLPGQSPKSAQLTRTDPRTRRESLFQGRQILWYLQNDHVQVKGARAGSSR